MLHAAEGRVPDGERGIPEPVERASGAEGRTPGADCKGHAGVMGVPGTERNASNAEEMVLAAGM